MTKSSRNVSAGRMSGGQAAVEALRAEGTRHVFGLIGSATMEMFDALYDADDVSFIGVHDERTGTHMADGYARASGGAGVVLAGQNGPGATNLVTGLAQAKAAYSPVVSVAGALSTAHQYRDAFQEVDQQALFAPITKKPGPCHLLAGCRKYSARRFARRWPRVAGRCRSICHAMCLPHRPTFLTGRHLSPIGLTACRRRIPTRSRRQRAFWRMPDNR